VGYSPLRTGTAGAAQAVVVVRGSVRFVTMEVQLPRLRCFFFLFFFVDLAFSVRWLNVEWCMPGGAKVYVKPGSR